MKKKLLFQRQQIQMCNVTQEILGMSIYLFSYYCFSLIHYFSTFKKNFFYHEMKNLLQFYTVYSKGTYH